MITKVSEFMNAFNIRLEQDNGISKNGSSQQEEFNAEDSCYHRLHMVLRAMRMVKLRSNSYN